MSSFRKPNGDDHPDASGKHLADAQALLVAGRPDGAAYLSGYVVECLLKSLLQAQGVHERGHRLTDLAQRVSQVCALAGARTARYVTQKVRKVPAAAIAGWRETMRYRSPSMTTTDAQIWVDEAEVIYQDTVAQMILDGVIR